MKPDLSSMRVILESALDDELPVPDLTEEHHLYEDLGLDSMAAVVMVVEIQKRFRVRIADDEVPRLMTVGEVMGKIVELSSAKDD